MRRPKAIDLFCGCGGFSEGFRRAGFGIVFANDKWGPAIKSYRHNHPNIVLSEKRIEGLSSGEILRKTGLGRGDVDVIMGGPPCQGFSLAGSRNPNDERNAMWKHFFRIVKGLVPDVIVMENVKGITLMNFEQGARTIDLIKKAFEKRGYKFTYKLLDMAGYGVPQHRMRVIMIANRIGVENGHLFPKETHGPGMKPYATVGETIMDLADMPDDLEFSHRRMNHTPELVDRMTKIPEGGKYRRRSFSFVYERLSRDKPSKTLVPGHSAFPVHPTQPRTLTVREAARLQTFPDKFRFFGSMVDQGLQVGNAVPPLFSYRLATSIKRVISGKQT